MVYRKSGGALAVNPCVEVNLRTTMGVVSSALGDNVVHSGCEGVMRVLYHKDKAALEQFKSTLQPPRFSDRRLSGGTLLLAIDHVGKPLHRHAYNRLSSWYRRCTGSPITLK